MAFEFPAWDPVLLEIPGLPIDIRWYGLMYVVGFIVAQWILMRLARARLLPLKPEAVPDLILWLVLGVLLGGRIGYALFYDNALLDPLKLVQLWKGGLSFHGGLLGVVVALAWFSRRHRVPTARMADACALAVCPGIFAVRMANFINGELFGRKTGAETPGAMRFPTDPVALHAMGLDHPGLSMRDKELAIQVAFDHLEWQDVADRVSRADAHGRALPWEDIRPRLDWEAVREQVPFRHPSQLYEGLGEGVLVGLMLLGIYLATRRRPLGPGAYGGLFLIGYGVVRFFIEFLRMPDVQFRDADDPVGTVFLGMTMGQTLCVGMVLAGGLMLWFARGRREEALPETAAEGGTS